MKRIIPLLISIIVTVALNAQTTKFFQFEQIHFSNISNCENGLNSEEQCVSYKVSVASDYFPNASSFNLAQPNIFDRPKQGSFIPCRVNYYYTEEDSIVRLISYTRDTKNSTTNFKDLMEPIHNQSEKLDKYNSEFDQLVNDLRKELGEPVEGTGEMNIKREPGYSDWYERKYVWKKEETTVELFMLWSENGGNLSTYKIRTKVYWN